MTNTKLRTMLHWTRQGPGFRVDGRRPHLHILCAQPRASHPGLGLDCGHRSPSYLPRPHWPEGSTLDTLSLCRATCLKLEKQQNLPSLLPLSPTPRLQASHPPMLCAPVALSHQKHLPLSCLFIFLNTFKNIPALWQILKKIWKECLKSSHISPTRQNECCQRVTTFPIIDLSTGGRMMAMVSTKVLVTTSSVSGNHGVYVPVLALFSK